MIVSKGLDLLLYLLQATGLAALIAKLVGIVGRNRMQDSGQRWVLARNEFCMCDYVERTGLVYLRTQVGEFILSGASFLWTYGFPVGIGPR